jgi:hypothetical protein
MRSNLPVFYVGVTVLFVVIGSSFAENKTGGNPQLASLPSLFEENVGQAPSPYEFVSRNSGVESLFSSAGVDLLVPDGKEACIELQLRFLNSRPGVVPVGRAPLSSVSNYLIGNDSSHWLRAIPNRSQVVYPEIYPGIDLIFDGNQNEIEHDFHVAPDADPNHVRFSIAGAKDISLRASGDLEVFLPHGSLFFKKPLAYQNSPSGHQDVSSAFALNSDGSISFDVGPYDHNRELVIDPVFSYSTYLAGNSADNIAAVTTDAAGNVYVTGFTISLDFPLVNAVQSTFKGSPEVFVSKLDPTGRTLLYSTYIGGSSRNYGNAIAVDSHGNIVVEGTSASNDFPHVGSVPALTCEGNNDCFFIASLKPDGSAFNYAGLIGGIEGTDVQTGQSGSGVLKLDSGGNAFIAGVTDDANFQITAGTLAKSVPGYPYNSTFVLKVNTVGALVYSTIIPGTEPLTSIPFANVFMPSGISVNSTGQATIAGTAGPGLPSTTGVIQPTFPNSLSTADATAGFVLRLNATASAINYATYVPGTDSIGGLAVDGLGNSYVTGGTSETNLPVSSNAYQKTLKPGPNCTCNGGFIVKLNGTGTSILAATYLGGTPSTGNAGTNFTGIALDSLSDVFVGGMTGSADFPLKNPFVSLWVSGESIWDMAIAGMSPDLSSLRFGTFLSSTDQIFAASQFSAIAVDSQNNLIVTGETDTTDFPTTSGSFEPTPPSQARHGFISKLNMAVAAPSVCLDTWSVNFGSVPAKTSSTQTVHLTNCGNTALNISALVSSASTVVAKESCGTIAAGSACAISLTFTPRDSSATVGTLTLRDNTVISPQVLQFFGQGIAPQLSPSSGSVDFGHLLVNTTGVSNPLFFQNTGNAALQISSTSVNGNFSITQNNCIGTIQPSNFCVISVVFKPTAAGIRTGTLTIVSNDPVVHSAGISLHGVGDSSYAVPVITSLSSPTAQIKNGPVTVEIMGANFYPASVVEVNGTAQTTTYLNGGELQATLSSTVSGSIGEVNVQVFNPTPGGGTSVGIPLTRYLVANIDAAFITTVPGSSLIFASVPSSSLTNPNTVIPINPSTGAFGTPISVGNDPGLLAASSDGSYLFVVANGDQTLQRINISTKAVDRTFPFPPAPCSGCGPQSGADLHGVPGAPAEVVLALTQSTNTFGDVALYNGSGLVNYVPTSVDSMLVVSSFAFAGTPSTIYALPFTTAQNSFFNIITLDSQGLHYTAPPPGNFGGNNTTGAQVVSDGTLLYTSAGEVWNPATQTHVGSFPVTTYNAASYPNLHSMIMDLGSGHIFLIGDEPYGLDSASIVLSAYGRTSLSLTSALAFPAVPEPIVQSLVRCGSNGFAFIGQGSDPFHTAVYLLTSSLASTGSSNPLPHISSVTPASVPKGSPTQQLTIDGQGFTESSVVKWNGAALQTTYVAKTVLTALVPSTDLANSGSALVAVVTPAPGGGTSNSVSFTIAPLAPLISFSSSALTFPTEPVGTASPSKTIAVQNPGTATLNISSISITGTGATSFHQTHICGSTLAPGANCSVTITFKPTAVGSFTAALSFSDNAAGSPQTVSLAGTGD